MTVRARCAVLALALLLAGCAGVRTRPGCVRVGPYGQACPLPPAALPAVEASHVVTIDRDGRHEAFLGRLRIDRDAVTLAASSLFGTELFTLRYDGNEVAITPAVHGIPADLVVVMLELAIADPARLRPRLYGMRLDVRTTADSQVRTLYERHRLVARIERSTGPLAEARIRMQVLPAKLTVTLAPLQASH